MRQWHTLELGKTKEVKQKLDQKASFFSVNLAAGTFFNSNRGKKTLWRQIYQVEKAEDEQKTVGVNVPAPATKAVVAGQF